MRIIKIRLVGKLHLSIPYIQEQVRQNIRSSVFRTRKVNCDVKYTTKLQIG